jgi:hypothetical protein
MRVVRSRNPLTGLSGLQLRLAEMPKLEAAIAGRNPLTGLSGLQRKRKKSGETQILEEVSQSPYGAKWFATLPP